MWRQLQLEASASADGLPDPRFITLPSASAVTYDLRSVIQNLDPVIEMRRRERQRLLQIRFFQIRVIREQLRPPASP